MQIGSSDVDSWEGDSELVNQHEAVAQQLTKCKAQTLLARTSACRRSRWHVPWRKSCATVLLLTTDVGPCLV
jgi:hypothetical protein